MPLLRDINSILGNLSNQMKTSMPAFYGMNPSSEDKAKTLKSLEGGGLGAPAITEDVEELLNTFRKLPFAQLYKERLLNASPPSIPGATSVSQNLLEDLSSIPKGKAGFETIKHPDADSWFMHVFRGLEGDPIGYLTQGEGKVQGLAIDPKSSPIQRAKAMMQLAQPVIKNRLELGELTDMGAEMLQKLQALAKRRLK